VRGDELLLLFSRSILKENPGATIIGEVKCSQTLYDDIAQKGGRGIMWKAGHSLIKGKMKEEHALMAGEMSGHIFFADRYFGYDDAIYASARLLEILSLTGQKLSQLLSDVPHTFNTPEIRVDCPDDVKFQVVEKVKTISRKITISSTSTVCACSSKTDGASVRASNHPACPGPAFRIKDRREPQIHKNPGRKRLKKRYGIRVKWGQVLRFAFLIRNII